MKTAVEEKFVSSILISNIMMKYRTCDGNNSPVSHSARHHRPARERHKIRIVSRENVDNQRQYKFYTLARLCLLINVNITILHPNTQTLTVYM